MAKKLTRDEMRELVARHGALEAESDWDGALATMADEPFYELFPYRIRVAGPQAIHSMWLRFSGAPGAPGSFAEVTVDPDSYHLSEYVNDDSVVHFTRWEFVTEGGERLPTDHIVIFRFKGDRILSESIFCDRAVMRYMDGALDAEFRSLPGVHQA